MSGANVIELFPRPNVRVHWAEIDYGPLDDSAKAVADEILETLEDCFLRCGIEERSNARNYLAVMLQTYRSRG